LDFISHICDREDMLKEHIGRIEKLMFNCIQICPNCLWMCCFVLAGMHHAQRMGEFAKCAF